jgi:hypothetical protein
LRGKRENVQKNVVREVNTEGPNEYPCKIIAVHSFDSSIMLPKCDRLDWVSGGNYNSKQMAGGFRGHTGPSVLALANFGTRPFAVG